MFFVALLSNKKLYVIMVLIFIYIYDATFFYCLLSEYHDISGPVRVLNERYSLLFNCFVQFIS